MATSVPLRLHRGPGEDVLSHLKVTTCRPEGLRESSQEVQLIRAGDGLHARLSPKPSSELRRIALPVRKCCLSAPGPPR